MVLTLHNIYFMKNKFTEKQAQEWILSHGYKLKIKDLTQSYDFSKKNNKNPYQWRYNQKPKQKFKSDSYITKILPNGVHMIFGQLKQK